MLDFLKIIQKEQEVISIMTDRTFDRKRVHAADSFDGQIAQKLRGRPQAETFEWYCGQYLRKDKHWEGKYRFSALNAFFFIIVLKA